MSAERLPFDELFLKEKLKSDPTTWETRRQLAHGLYDKQAYAEAAEIIWTTDQIPNTDIDLAFAIRVLAKAQPRRAIRLLTAVLELNQGKAVQNMAMANALLHHGMVLQAARFYGAALEADHSLVNPDLEHFILWSDDESTMWDLFDNHHPKLGELPWMLRDPKEALRLTSRVSLHTTPIKVPDLPVVAAEHLKHDLYQQEAKHNAKITPPPAVTIPIDRVDPKDRLYDETYGASVVRSEPVSKPSKEVEEVAASAPPILSAPPEAPAAPAPPILPVLPAASAAPPILTVKSAATAAAPVLRAAAPILRAAAVPSAPPITSPAAEVSSAPPITSPAAASSLPAKLAFPAVTPAASSAPEAAAKEAEAAAKEAAAKEAAAKEAAAKEAAAKEAAAKEAAAKEAAAKEAAAKEAAAKEATAKEAAAKEAATKEAATKEAAAKEAESVGEIAEKDTTTSSAPAPAKVIEPFPSTVKFPEITGPSTRVTLSARKTPLEEVNPSESAEPFPSKVVFPDISEPAASTTPDIPKLTPEPAAPFFADPTPSSSIPLPPIQSEKKEESEPEKESTDTIKKAPIPEAFPISQSAVPTTLLRVKWSTAPARPGGAPATPSTSAPVAPPLPPPVSAPIPFASPSAPQSQQPATTIPFSQSGAPTDALTSASAASGNPSDTPTNTPTPEVEPAEEPAEEPAPAPVSAIRRLLFLPGRAVPPAGKDNS